LIWYLVDTQTGAETPVGGASQSLLSLGFGEDSSYQNTSEYIGALLAIVGAIAMGHMHLGLGLRGDSMSALQWVKKGKTKSELAMPAAFTHACLLRKEGADVQGEEFLDGKSNWRTDGLSRGKDIAWIAEQDPRFMDVPVVDVNWGVWVELCDPGQDMKTQEGFLVFWNKLSATIKKFYQDLV
jgi:hypothetical protein